jgi:hypothetical protein
MTITNVMIPAYVPKPKNESATPYVVVMKVTPEIAAFWLKTYNASNRPINRPHVLFLSSQMKNGQWIEMNGTTISFSPEQQINDGQHRLAAIVDSGISYNFVVMVGVSINAFKVMDTGRRRGAADVLAIEGYKNYAIVASAAAFIMNWERGKFAKVSTGGRKKVSNTDVSNFALENKSTLLPICSTAKKYYTTSDKLLGETIIAGLLFLLSKKDVKLAEAFVFKLATGANVEYGSGLYKLRSKLHSVKISDTVTMSRRSKLAFIVKVWNGMRKGKEVQNLVFRASNGEKFPKII